MLRATARKVTVTGVIDVKQAELKPKRRAHRAVEEVRRILTQLAHSGDASTTASRGE